jgi:hypothetical protein
MEKPGLDGHGVLVLQGWPPALDKEEDGVRPKPFFIFLFLFLIFLPLPQAVTRALPFKTIKGEVGTPSRGIDEETDRSTHQSTQQPTLETYTTET